MNAGIRELEKKVIDRERAAKIGGDMRSSGRALVFTNGCFDLIHPGHIDLLIRARSLGDALMVGLNTDASVRRLKGAGRPILDEGSRSQMLAALEVVNWVVLFDEDTPIDLIREVGPTILVKGGDYTPEAVVGKEIVEGLGGNVVIVPITMQFSTSAIMEKIHPKSGE
jgi:rfaE bifunctional protein nucleotidyltransferase chain/domain